MYNPIIPIEINCIPPKNIVLIAIDVHPVMVVFNTKWPYIAYRIAINDKNEIMIPACVTILNGLSENEVIPSSATRIILLSG